jgi:hypothetical protein
MGLSYNQMVPGHLYSRGYDMSNPCDRQEALWLNWALRRGGEYFRNAKEAGRAVLDAGAKAFEVSHSTIGDLDIFRVGQEGRCLEMVLPR